MWFPKHMFLSFLQITDSSCKPVYWYLEFDHGVYNLIIVNELKLVFMV